MALRAGLKLRVKRRYLVAFLSLLTLSAVMISTHSPSPSEQRNLPSRGPQHNQPTGTQDKDSVLPQHHLPSNGYSGAWKRSKPKDMAKHVLVKSYNQQRVQQATQKHTKSKAKNVSNKSKQGLSQSKPKRSPQTFRANPLRRLANKLGDGSDPKHAIHPLLPKHDQTIPQPASGRSLHPDIKLCRHKCTPDGPKPVGFKGKAGAQQPVELQWPSGETEIYKRQAKSSERKRQHLKHENNSISRAGTERKDFMTGWCETAHNEAFMEGWNQTRPESLPWLSKDDVEKIKLLAGGTVLSKARVPGHGQVLQVGLGGPDDIHAPLGGNHSRLCQKGSCALIKRSNDWFEVLAFHLDRVLGLNRSLPAVLRTFHSDILPYKYTRGSQRPVVWWDPNIQHLADNDNDQNSFSLTWPQYQAILKIRCGTYVPLNSSKCVGVHHSEWGRLALFDFLLQVNDRLDRNCCGFQPDPADLCVENLLNVKCAHPKDLMLVHILVRKTDPSKLVFIDNAGRLHQRHDNLNFRLLEGNDEFPEKAVSVLRSGCLEQMLLHSLSVDRNLWESRGGAAGLKSTVHILQQRAKLLLQHIQDKTIRLNNDT